MELLLAYALLLCENYDYWELYSEELDRLFLDAPQNDIYLYLETTTDIKQAVRHIFTKKSEIPLDYELLGRTLMRLVGDIYLKSELKDFSAHMCSLWTNFPSQIYMEEPFFTLNYAGDCLSYGDEEQCRKLFENAIHFYD